MTLASLAARHCLASKPAICLKPFVMDNYGIKDRGFNYVAAGKRKPSNKLLLAMNAAQVRLFPGETVAVPLNDGSTAHLGPAGLTISFPS